MGVIKYGSVAIGVLYLLFCTTLFFVQDQLLFRPSRLAEEYNYRTGEEVEIQVDEAVYLNGIWLKTDHPKGTIIYLHGNKGHAARALYQAQQTLVGHGYDVLIVDYRGYGKSDGTLENQAQLYEDLDHIYAFAKSSSPNAPLIVAGYSLGSGMASYLAAHHQLDGLILIAPFRSITALKNRRLWWIPDFLVRYPLATEDRIVEINCPILILHGTEDQVIPFEHGQWLSKQNNRSTFVALDGQNHRQVILSPTTAQSIRDWLNRRSN